MTPPRYILPRAICCIATAESILYPLRRTATKQRFPVERMHGLATWHSGQDGLPLVQLQKLQIYANTLF